MIHSPELADLAAALCSAQEGFTAVPKGSTNPFFKSRYAGLPAVVEAASPILAEHGLAVSQLLGHDEQGDTLTTVLMHRSGQFIADTMHLRPVKDDPQAQGSATTYGRRYAYMAALGLVADEDDDGNAGSAPAVRATRPKSRPKSAPKTEGAAPATAAEPVAGKPDSSAPPPAPEANPNAEAVVARLRTIFDRSDWDNEKLRWGLVEVGCEDPSDIKAALLGLSLDAAILLGESMGGSAAEVTGTEA